MLTAAEGAVAKPGPDDPLDVRVVYARPKGRQWLGWPGTFWDPESFTGKSRTLVEEFAKQLGMKVSFEPAPIHEPAEVEAFVKKVKAERPKGVIVFPLNADEFISGTIDKIAQSGIPTVIFCGLGMFHTGFAGAVVPTARRKGVYLPSSSDYELGPVRFGMKMIQAAYRLRRTKVAVLRGTETAEQKMEPLGLTIRFLPRRRFPDTLKTIQETPEVVAMAEEYAKAAKKVVEPTRADLINAAKNYFASRKIMEEEGCQGISMDCLGLVGNREIPTPPCLSWTRLLDSGRQRHLRGRRQRRDVARVVLEAARQARLRSGPRARDRARHAHRRTLRVRDEDQRAGTSRRRRSCCAATRSRTSAWRCKCCGRRGKR